MHFSSINRTSERERESEGQQQNNVNLFVDALSKWPFTLSLNIAHKYEDNMIKFLRLCLCARAQLRLRGSDVFVIFEVLSTFECVSLTNRF